MEQRLASVIHWYDTDARRIACGTPGLTGSTKHKREVTCTRCRAVLAARVSAAGEPQGVPPVYAS